MILKIIKADILEDYWMLITFNTGEKIKFDCSMLFDFPMYRCLEDVGLFKQFTLNGDTICWPGNIDIAPEFIYKNGTKDDIDVDNSELPALIRPVYIHTTISDEDWEEIRKEREKNLKWYEDHEEEEFKMSGKEIFEKFVNEGKCILIDRQKIILVDTEPKIKEYIEKEKSSLSKGYITVTFSYQL